MADTFEQVVATNGAQLKTPTYVENGRYAYGSQNSSTYEHYTRRDGEEETPEDYMLNYAAFCCNTLALDIALEELKEYKTCFLTSLTRSSDVAPRTLSEGYTRLNFDCKIAIPLKPLLLRFKGDINHATQVQQINAITCENGSTDFYIIKDAEFDVIKYIDITKHSASLTNEFHYQINENKLLYPVAFDGIHALEPDTGGSFSHRYDDLITTYETPFTGITIKFDYVVFSRKKDPNTNPNAMHVVSAYGITIDKRIATAHSTKYYQKTIGTISIPSVLKLPTVNDYLYGDLPGAIVSYTKSAQGHDYDITDPTQYWGADYRFIIGSVTRTNHANYNTTTHKYSLDYESKRESQDIDIDAAVEANLPTVKGRSNKGLIYNCMMSMLVSLGFEDEFYPQTQSMTVDSVFHIDLYHNDIINTDYVSSTDSPIAGYDFSLFMSNAVFDITPTNYLDSTARIAFDQINNFLFEPAKLIDIVYELHMCSYEHTEPHVHFQFDRYTETSDQVKSTFHDFIGTDMEDFINYVESSPSLQYTESTPFITPMEYYAQGKTDFAFDDKVLNTTSTEDEPTYFWIETLKNWGRFVINGQMSKDANIVVDLLLWNGSGQWVSAATLLDNVKKNFIPKRLYQYYVNRVKQLAPSAPPTEPSEEYDEINQKLNNMWSMLMARNSTLPFKFENITTVDIERAYHCTNADYAGHSSRSWWEYLPIVYVAKGAWSMVKAAWNFSPAGMFYNAIWGDGIWEGIKSGYKDTFDCIYSWTAERLVDIIKLGIDLFFTDDTDPFISKLDPYQHLQAICRYIVLPYDEKYSNNDSTTLQTIRPDLIRYTDLEGGIINREPIIEYSVIPNVIGSPFVARSSTGELMIAYRMCYSGPTKEDADGAHDLIKYSGILEKDVEFSNKLLQDKFGKGEDKTAIDMFNTYGKLPSAEIRSTATSKLPVSTETAGVERLTNSVQTTTGAIVLKTNRSKTSSDSETAGINTLTKW